MTSIPSSQPTLATTLLDLSSQTTSASQNSGTSDLLLPSDSTATGSDTLELSQKAAAQLQAVEQQIAQQNNSSTLADSAAALAANNSAISFLGQDPTLAQSAQGSTDASAVLNLL
jgi:hypothetical protein